MISNNSINKLKTKNMLIKIDNAIISTVGKTIYECIDINN